MIPVFDMILVTISDTVAQKVTIPRVADGGIYVIETISVVNESSATTSIDLVVAGRQLDYPIVTIGSPTAGYIYNHVGKIVIMDDQRIGAIFRGASSGDRVRVTAFGYKYADS